MREKDTDKDIKKYYLLKNEKEKTMICVILGLETCEEM